MNALPILLLGGAALLVMGGSKPKYGGKRVCVYINKPEDLATYQSQVKPPMYLIVHPGGVNAQSLYEQVCELGNRKKVSIIIMNSATMSSYTGKTVPSIVAKLSSRGKSSAIPWDQFVAQEGISV